jgi:hypothetical protein
MRSILVKAGLTALLLSSAFAVPAAGAAGGAYLQPAYWGEHVFWGHQHPGWFGAWGARPYAREARLDTVLRELRADDVRIRDDRRARRLTAADSASLRAEDAAIRSEALRSAALHGGVSYGEYLRLQGQVGALSRDIAHVGGWLA